MLAWRNAGWMSVWFYLFVFHLLNYVCILIDLLHWLPLSPQLFDLLRYHVLLLDKFNSCVLFLLQSLIRLTALVAVLYWPMLFLIHFIYDVLLSGLLHVFLSLLRFAQSVLSLCCSLSCQLVPLVHRFVSSHGLLHNRVHYFFISLVAFFVFYVRFNLHWLELGFVVSNSLQLVFDPRSFELLQLPLCFLLHFLQFQLPLDILYFALGSDALHFGLFQAVLCLDFHEFVDVGVLRGLTRH